MKKIFALTGSFFISLVSFAQVNKTVVKGTTVQKVQANDVQAKSATVAPTNNTYKTTLKKTSGIKSTLKSPALKKTAANTANKVNDL